MFWNIFVEGIKNGYMNDLYIVILLISIIAMIHHTFMSRWNRIQTILAWSVICIGMVFAFRLFYAIQNFIFISKESFFLEHKFAYDIFYNFGIWIFLIQILFLIAGAKLIYKNSIRIMEFAILLLYMFVSLIADYFMPLLLVALRPTVTENGYYIGFETGGGSLYLGIGIFISVILYIIYRKYVSRAMDILLSLSEEHYKKLIYIPLLSYITYSVFYLLMGYVDVYPYMPGRIVYFVLVFATLIIIYLTMYIALFYGIFSAGKTMKLKAELDVASRIQTSNLPKLFQNREDLSVYAMMETALEVGGDFYDYFFIDDNHLAVVIADVSGKGVPAALFMMMSKTLIQNDSAYQYSPSDILTHVNNQLCENNESQMFVTVFMGILEVNTGQFLYANAGHNSPIIIKHKGNCEYLKARNGFVLAGRPNTKYMDNEIYLEKGDKLFLYTDGVTEAINKGQELFGEERLLELFKTIDKNGLPVEGILDVIKKELKNFTDEADQEDDITMLLLAYNGIFTPSKKETFLHVGITQ